MTSQGQTVSHVITWFPRLAGPRGTTHARVGGQLWQSKGLVIRLPEVLCDIYTKCVHAVCTYCNSLKKEKRRLGTFLNKAQKTISGVALSGCNRLNGGRVKTKFIKED
jgi:hypothetical protein